MPTIDFTRYYRYDELTDMLKTFAEEYPRLAGLASIGKSYERRDIWCLTRRRAPDEEGGTYYRVYTEGRIRNYDGYNIKIAPPRQGLDFNRSFPYLWAPEGEEQGSGPYPLSEAETRAVVHFITEHPNI